MMAASLVPLMAIVEGLIGRERAVGYRDGEVRDRRRNKRIDRVIIRNESIGAGRTIHVERAVGTSLRYIVVYPIDDGAAGGSTVDAES